ncbi:hypothetical protein HMPREF0797_1379 [Staphylococcus epidermidis SK135]|nr:hypothetical protein HMPREF0797_1379 [Staphylococcus epidermidis SK135]
MELFLKKIKSLINQSSVPVVVSGTDGKDDHIASVNIDFKQAAEEATQYLYREGC